MRLGKRPRMITDGDEHRVARRNPTREAGLDRQRREIRMDKHIRDALLHADQHIAIDVPLVAYERGEASVREPEAPEVHVRLTADERHGLLYRFGLVPEENLWRHVL